MIAERNAQHTLHKHTHHNTPLPYQGRSNYPIPTEPTRGRFGKGGNTVVFTTLGFFTTVDEMSKQEDFSFRSSTEFRKNCTKRTEINSFVD